MNANLFDEIYNGLDHAMSCYLDTKAAKAGNVVKLYGTNFGGEFGKAQNLNSVEMYAIYSNRKNKSGNYNLKGFNIIVTNFETGETKTFESVTEAMEFVAHLMNEENNETNENDIMEETDDMYQYASEAAEEEEAKMEIQTEGMYEYAQEAYTDIEAYAEDAVCLYQDIERTLEDPDYGNLEDTVIQLWKRLEDIHNAFGICLDRCNYLTGCDITFDDFCGTDYFSDIEIPSYMGWDLEDLMYDGDPTNVLENILDNIIRENPEYIDTLSAAIDGTGLYLAA